MRVLCPYEPEVHPLTRQSLKQFAPETEFVKLGADPNAYWRFFCDQWQVKQDFVVVEHDIEIREGVLEEFEECPSEWCTFAYGGAPHPTTEQMYIDKALGCVRFRSALLKRHPQIVAAIGLDQTTGKARRQSEHDRDWRRLDSGIAYGLLRQDVQPHTHLPPVKHHHDYPAGCACGEDHELTA